MRSALLSSISHDLRTPLAAIAGAGSSLLDPGATLEEASKQELLQTIVEESTRMAMLVDNLLHITRLESGAMAVNKQWYPLEEVIGSALERLKKQLGSRPIRTDVPPDMPLVRFDGMLIEQVLVNILDNATKYTLAESPIEVCARVDGQHAVLEVADRGPGLAEKERLRVFDKFYRGSAAAKGQRGVGLGLAICRAIIEAHGGRIWEENRPDGGARFIFTIPLEGQPPTVDADPDMRPADKG
jgi:two-component system sensor histidine kinase KdpD